MKLGRLPTTPPADTGLSGAEWAHLTSEYAGVFDEAMLRRHVADHLGPEVAAGYVALVERRAPGARRLLDVACGWGAFVEAASGIWDVVGADLAPVELSHARARRLPVIQADATCLPVASGSVDVVTMWNVLEHVDDTRSVIGEAHRALRSKGSLFVEAPNYFSFRREAHYHVPWWPGLRGRAATRWLRLLARDPRFFRTSVRPCTWRSITRELRDAGFDIHPLREEKLRDPSTIRRPMVRRAVITVRRLGLDPVLGAFLVAESRNPLQPFIRIHAVRP